MWWIIGIAVIGLIIYNINKDHNEHVSSHVTRQGGMLKKYRVVIDYLKQSGLEIQKVTKDNVTLSSRSATWTLDYVGSNLEVKMKAYLPLLGNINKKWSFPSGYPQEKMIEEFNNFANWQIEQLQRNAQNSAYEHLNTK